MISQVQLASDSESDDLDFKPDTAAASSSDSEREDARPAKGKADTPRQPLNVDTVWLSMNAPDTHTHAPASSILEYYQTVGANPVQDEPAASDAKQRHLEFAGVRIDPDTLKPMANTPACGSINLHAPAERRPERPKHKYLDYRLALIGKKFGIKADAALTHRLTTLQKSKLDWQKHVKDSDMTQDLKRARKDGYLDRVAFLKGSDERTLQLFKEKQKEAASSSSSKKRR
ncbi:MAG: hypothetical protein SGCHY_002281 [Lobulomycetales sp.]